ncbi:MAG TPA: LacI family DNA-binding transcriptional regulator [Opitutus sp.]|nr:LacI family DNA-binding transcriptional regulator [Opitutus sp.]
MTGIPQRLSLVSQTAAYLRTEIERGAWDDWLPSERALCQSLQVSRNTLRAALVQLKRDRVIRSMHGAGNRIELKSNSRARQLQSHDVAFLTPEPLEQLRPMQTLWIDELRAMLSERGCRLHVFHGRQYFRTNPGPALAKLTQQNLHGCWVLILSNEKTQSWFEQNRVPCIVAGSVYAGVDLPFRDIDHRAMCRHAAGAMLAAGHRKVALIIQRSRRAGDVASETGFLEGVRQSSHPDATAVICPHDSTVSGICNALRRLMEQRPAPTALLVANPNHYLTIASRLSQMGWRVPEDVSVVSRDEDPFLSYLLPTPARYVTNAYALAKSLLRPVLELLAGGAVTHRAVRIMPSFVRGESLMPPRR